MTVNAGGTTTATLSTINLKQMTFTSGDTLLFLIESRDAYGNINLASVAEVYTVTLTGITTGTITNIVPTSNNNGTYSVQHVFTSAESYTLTV